MADGIKGSQYQKFSIPLQKGIILHRAIDTYTDAHPVVRQSTRRLHKNYSHYSGIIVDILYDHYLAKNWDHYCEIPLASFAEKFYGLLDKNWELLTPGIKRMIPYMIEDNWLLSYAEIEGIATVLRNMNRRTKNRSGMDRAIDDLRLHYAEFEDEFTRFFTDLETFSNARLKQIHQQFDLKK